MKIHKINLQAKAKDYSGSPHIFHAIKRSNFSSCGIITDSITHCDDILTCKACIEITNKENTVNFEDHKRMFKFYFFGSIIAFLATHAIGIRAVVSLRDQLDLANEQLRETNLRRIEAVHELGELRAKLK